MPRREIFLLTVKGERARPGLTASLAETMGKHDVTILDVGQAEIHDMLSLGMLIEAPAEPGLNVLKEIVFMAHHLGLTVNFTPISSPDYERWVAEQTKPRFTVTLLTRRLQAQYLAIVTKILFENNLNIDSITRLSGRMSLRGNGAPGSGGGGYTKSRSALQFEVSGKPRNVDQMREELFKVSLTQPVDIAIQEDDLFRRNRRLILFDMDSTLIQVCASANLSAPGGVCWHHSRHLVSFIMAPVLAPLRALTCGCGGASARSSTSWRRRQGLERRWLKSQR